MADWPTYLFAALLIGMSLALLAHHLAQWREQHTLTDTQVRAFLQRQFRRRSIASSLIGVTGVALIVGLWIESTLPALLFWTTVLAVVLLILALAVQDAFASRRFADQAVAEELQRLLEEHQPLEDDSDPDEDP